MRVAGARVNELRSTAAEAAVAYSVDEHAADLEVVVRRESLVQNLLGRLAAVLRRLGFAALLGRPRTRGRDGDLTASAMERTMMETGMDAREITRLRRIFLASVEDAAVMRLEEFMLLGPVAACPLRDRLAHVFGFGDRGEINFYEFMSHVAELNGSASRERTMSVAFRIHDMDGDGVISRDDMLQYLRLVAGSGDDQDNAGDGDSNGGRGTGDETDEDDAVGDGVDMATFGEHTLVEVVDRIFREASTDLPRRRFLTKSDFRLVIGGTDFEAKLRLHF